ncbi:T-cell leukemia/lymphoma protein 1A [Myotis brandtii]|uniref:T-cell leukemia/lymphoma protein 1A n=1 Tax=Myotis brandtii TaxID=109478 RepID=S7PHN9_MYOBR|nr:T-cell leukemia/lymphoma protein 1A [Myotis brandtii]
MAELPSKVHLTSHPVYLRRWPWVYEDENDRTWLPLVMEIEGVLQVRLRQEDTPSGHIALTTSPLTLCAMPSMWTLHLGSKYQDCRCRFWRIVHHIKENGVEEMVLQLMEDL